MVRRRRRRERCRRPRRPPPHPPRSRPGEGRHVGHRAVTLQTAPRAAVRAVASPASRRAQHPWRTGAFREHSVAEARTASVRWVQGAGVPPAVVLAQLGAGARPLPGVEHGSLPTAPVIGSSAANAGTWWRARIEETVRPGTPLRSAIHPRLRHGCLRRSTTSSTRALLARDQPRRWRATISSRPWTLVRAPAWGTRAPEQVQGPRQATPPLGGSPRPSRPAATDVLTGYT